MNNRGFKFYYGWVIVAVSFFTLFLSLGIRISFSVYYIAILEEYGWTRADTAGAFSLAMIFHAFFAPITGILIDRFGPRRLFPAGGVFLFFGLLAASRISSILQLYIFFGVFMAIGINMISYAPHMSIIPRWFNMNRGLASGLVLSGIGLGSLLLVPFSQLLINSLGWRSSFLIFSGIVLFILVPINAIFQRDSPGDVGQHRDGIKPEEACEHAASRCEPPSEKIRARLWTFRDAMKTRSFWFLVIAVFCDGFIISTFVVHQAVYIVDMGYTKLMASALVGIVGILGSAGGILVGILSDRVGSRNGYFIGGVLSITGIIFLILIKDASAPWLAYAFAVIYGLGYGGKMPTLATITGGFYPGKALGRILSIHAVAFGAGGALGPYLGGVLFDLTGSYFIMFLILIMIIIIGSFMVQMAFFNWPSIAVKKQVLYPEY